MVNNNERNATTWHRVVIASVVTVMAGASITAAAYNGGQDGKRVKRDVVVMRAEHDGEMGAKRQALLDTASAAPTERYVDVEATPEAPVAITDAQIKKVPAEALAASMAIGPDHKTWVSRRVEKKIEGDVERELELSGEPGEKIRVRKFPETDADGNARVLLVTITNVSGQAVTGYQFGNSQTDGEKTAALRFFFNKKLEPGESHTFVVPVGGPMFESDAALRVLGVVNADGTTWGEAEMKEHMIFVRRMPDAGEEL